MAVDILAVSWQRLLTEQESQQLFRVLPEQKRGPIEKLRLARKRQESLCAYALLKHALTQHGLKSWPTLAFSKTGKPFFQGCDFFFNLCHSEGAAVAALADRPIGVDIERLRPVSARIQQRLEASGQTLENYYEDWVEYEARVKLSGEGVHIHRTSPVSEVPIRKIPLFPGYAAAVAGAVDEPSVQLLTIEELLEEL